MSDRRLIYAVDDELSIREVYRYAIGGAGFDIQCFENGEGLFSAINAQLPDLVLLDIFQERQKALAVFHWLSGRDPFICIIADDGIIICLGIFRQDFPLCRKRQTIQVLLFR